MNEFITVLHGSAYTCKGDAASQWENGNFWGVRTPQPLNRLTKNLTHLIRSMSWPRNAKFHKIQPHKG